MWVMVILAIGITILLYATLQWGPPLIWVAGILFGVWLMSKSDPTKNDQQGEDQVGKGGSPS